MGALNKFQFDTHTISMYILYALMLQVGVSIGSNKKSENNHFTPASQDVTNSVGNYHRNIIILCSGKHTGKSMGSVFDCMAVGSGFAYYSLSSILITQFKEPSIGLQLATELGTIALLTNIFREMMALLGTPLIKKYFGKLAPISAAGVNSMDVLLPSISRYSGKEMIPIAILHGILIDMSVPVFVSFSSANSKSFNA